MSNLRIVALTGGYTVLEETAVQHLKASLRGELLLPGDARYDEVRKVWNGRIDKRPALIVRCAGVADVIAAIRAVFSAVRPLVGSGSWHPIRQNSAPEWWQPSSKGT